jgi:hypothetical protein
MNLGPPLTYTYILLIFINEAYIYPKRYTVCIASETVISKCPSRAKEGLSAETEVRDGNCQIYWLKFQQAFHELKYNNISYIQTAVILIYI